MLSFHDIPVTSHVISSSFLFIYSFIVMTESQPVEAFEEVVTSFPDEGEQLDVSKLDMKGNSSN